MLIQHEDLAFEKSLIKTITKKAKCRKLMSDYSTSFFFKWASAHLPAGVKADATDINVSVYTVSDPMCVPFLENTTGIHFCNNWKYIHALHFFLSKCITGRLLTDCGRGQLESGSSQQLYAWDGNAAIEVLTRSFCCPL